MAPDTARTIPELLQATREDAAEVISSTMALAKAETADSARKAGIGSALVVAAIGLAWFALVALTVAFGFGLVALGLPIWAAFLIVTGVFLLVAAGLVFAAIRLFKKIEPPHRTIEAVKGTFAAFGASRDPDAAFAGDDA